MDALHCMALSLTYANFEDSSGPRAFHLLYRTIFHCTAVTNCCPTATPICDSTDCELCHDRNRIDWNHALSACMSTARAGWRGCGCSQHAVVGVHLNCIESRPSHGSLLCRHNQRACKRSTDTELKACTSHPNVVYHGPAPVHRVGVASCVFPRVRDARHGGFDDQCIPLQQGCGDNCVDCATDGACQRCQSDPLYRLEGTRYVMSLTSDSRHCSAESDGYAVFFNHPDAAPPHSHVYVRDHG